MTTYLEHANITVPDVDAAIVFLRTLDPTLRVRRDETPGSGRRWAHVGSDRAYVALQAAGYRRGIEVDAHPHRKRSYDYDAAGLEWEILQYLSDDPAEFNDCTV